MNLRQRCKACGREDKFDFHVPDDIWRQVVPPELVNRVVCLGCFDEFARGKAVDYAPGVKKLYFAGDQAVLVFTVESANNGGVVT